MRLLLLGVALLCCALPCLLLVAVAWCCVALLVCALPCLALPCLALPCLVLSCLALSCLVFAFVVCFVLFFALYVHKPMALGRKLDDLADIVRLGVWMPLQHLLELFVVNVGRLLLDHRRLGSGTTHHHGTTKRLHSFNTHMHMRTQTHTHTHVHAHKHAICLAHTNTPKTCINTNATMNGNMEPFSLREQLVRVSKIARLAATASQKNTRRANLTCPVASGFCTQHRWCHTAATSP